MTVISLHVTTCWLHLLYLYFTPPYISFFVSTFPVAAVPAPRLCTWHGDPTSWNIPGTLGPCTTYIFGMASSYRRNALLREILRLPSQQGLFRFLFIATPTRDMEAFIILNLLYILRLLSLDPHTSRPTHMHVHTCSNLVSTYTSPNQQKYPRIFIL